MMPMGPLMKEHRVIERMVALVQAERERVSAGQPPDTGFLAAAVDFFRTYADRCHHGKEEDILFRDLAKKELTAEHRRVMEELIAEHVIAREIVSGLERALEACWRNEEGAGAQVSRQAQRLVRLYPVHIAKEDKGFFRPAMGYLGKAEQAQMLAEFSAFDAQLIHEKYRDLLTRWEGQ